MSTSIIMKVCGWGMIVALLVGMFVGLARDVGVKVAVVTYGACAALMVFISVAVWLIGGKA